MTNINLFGDAAQANNERVDLLLKTDRARIERIVSWGQASPPDFWYDQPEGEWVALLSGHARLRLRAPDELLELCPGDWLWIAAHRLHRVDWTAPGIATRWLAVFLAEETR